MSRVLLIGLDCVPPGLAFGRYLQYMPHLAALMARGTYARLRSTFPPITVPAWTSMISGRDPGELGVYGFRSRRAGQYALSTVDARAIQTPRVWDVLAEHGKRSAVLFVPPSYPPLRVNGECVSCFLTPDADVAHTFPERLAGELAARFGAYIPDVDHVGKADKSSLYEALERMTTQHFAIARHIWETRHPDFMMMVEIGPDRLHHLFWEHFDPEHSRYVAGNPFEQLGPRYYALLDRELGALCASAGEDTTIMVASDHGARALQGAFCINEWLLQQGFLVLRADSVTCAQPLSAEQVDWPRTRAWAEGGYYARVFLNVRGREPQGCVPVERFDSECAALRAALSHVRGPNGKIWNNRVETPYSLYRSVRGDAPDLLAVFDDLNVRALSVVGSGRLFADGDDRGADGCNHDWDGIFVLAGDNVTARGERATCEIYDVGASVLSQFGIDKPVDWLGEDRSLAR